MTVRYVAINPLSLVRYAASNLATHGYHFWTTFPIPANADLHAIDLKMLLMYRSHLSKERVYRRRVGGEAAVKYVRCGRVGLFMATKGRSEFFHREPFRDVRSSPLCVAGHSIRVIPDTHKTVVRIHREAHRRLVEELIANAGLPLRDLEALIWNLPFLPYRGVRDGILAALRELNGRRRKLRLHPIDWRRCVRKKIPTGPIFLPTPPEVAEVLDWYRKQR